LKCPMWFAGGALLKKKGGRGKRRALVGGAPWPPA